MFKNYFKIAFRKLVREKFYTFINIFGLALGITSFFLISSYVMREMSYDDFHKNKNNIYRINRVSDEASGKVISASVPNALPNALRNDFPALKNVINIASSLDEEISVGDKKFKGKLLLASPNFFDMFDFQLQAGNYKQLYENINSILITEHLADKLFGSESPIGKTLSVHGQLNLIVAGIVKDIPENSSFQFDAFISKDVLYKYILPGEEKKWYSMGVETFVEFSPMLTPENLSTQFPDFLKKYLPDYMQGKLKLKLQPLTDIHTSSNIESNLFPPVSESSLIIFFVIACTILAIASINFINLTSARQFEREKELSVRKVVGASRRQIVIQFLVESFLMTIFASAFGFLMMQFILPYFNYYIQPSLKFNFIDNFTYAMLGGIFILLLGFINGLYPAFLFSGREVSSILRKENRNLFGKIRSRYLLLTLQFGITIALILSVISIYSQISFMKNKNLGFISDNLIVIPTNTNPTETPSDKNIKLFTEILNNEGLKYGIISAAFSENVPGSYFPNQFGVVPAGSNNDNEKQMIITRSVNEDFFKTYRMNFIAGRNFSSKMSTDYDQAAIINETAAKMLGWENPIGKNFHFASDNRIFTVIGVINDIHFRSLQNKIEPLIFIECWGIKNFITARIQSDKTQNIISYLKKEWENTFPALPFEYHFVKDMYLESYKAEDKLLGAILTFAGLAIILASLGLFGLTAIATVQRTKEIGIRKVLGASVLDVVTLISKDFILWILAANFIAQPLAYYFMDNWLQDFAYRIDISWWIFVLSGGIALLIALATVSFQAIKAATANPVEALRYE